MFESVLKSRNIQKAPLSHSPSPQFFSYTSSPAGAIRDQSIVKASTSVALKFPFKMVPADIVFLVTGKSVVFVYSSTFIFSITILVAIGKQTFLLTEFFSFLRNSQRICSRITMHSLEYVVLLFCYFLLFLFGFEQ